MRKRRRDTPGKAKHKTRGAARRAVGHADSGHTSTGTKTLLTALALAGIILLGFVLRASYLRQIVDNPDFSSPQIDAGYFDYWARGLATGHWTLPKNLADFADPEIRTRPFFRPPAYPYFLSVVYRLTGGSYLAARIVQMAIGLANCVLAYFLGRRIFSRPAGLIFALLMSVYWVFIFFEGELLATVLLVTLGLSLFYLLSLWPDKFTFARGLAAGAILGLFVLTRANVLLFGPVVLAWSWWVARRRKDNRPLRPIWLGFVLGGLVIVSPVTIRNWIVAKDFVMISTNAGISMYTGNHENATGRYAVIPNLRKLGLTAEWTCFDYSKMVRGIESLKGRPMKHSEVSSYFVGKSLDFIRTHPVRALKLMAIKTALFWGPEEVPNNKSMACEKANSATLRYMPGFPLPVSLAVLGLLQLLLSRRKKPEQDAAAPPLTDRQVEVSTLIALFVLVYFLSYLPFFIAGRYRVPVIPFLFLFGAYGLCQTGRLFMSAQYRPASLRLAALVGLYLLASIHIVPYESDDAQWRLLRATCYRLADKFDLAAEECRQAVRIEPDLEKAHRRLADMLFRTEDYRGAAEHYLKALQLGPSPDYVYPRIEAVGVMFSRQGDTKRAISHFQKVLSIKPDFPEAHYRLANMLKREDNTDQAIGHYQQAIKLRPGYYQAHNNLANALLNKGKLEQAIEHYREALKIKPDYAEAQRNLNSVLRPGGAP